MYCDQTFKNIYYLPVENRTFHDISVLVADQKGIAYRNPTSSPTSVIYNNGSLVLYYRRRASSGRKDIRPIYTTPPFVHLGHGLRSVLSGLFRTLRQILLNGAKSMGTETLKALGRKALLKEAWFLQMLLKILRRKPKTISKHVSDSTQNIMNKMRGGGGRKRKRSLSATQNSEREKLNRLYLEKFASGLGL